IAERRRSQSRDALSKPSPVAQVDRIGPRVQTPSSTVRTSPVAGKPGRLLLACALMALCSSASARAAEKRAWVHSPYRVSATIAVDDGSRPQPGLEAGLAKSIADRVEGALRPLWEFKSSVPDG